MVQLALSNLWHSTHANTDPPLSCTLLVFDCAQYSRHEALALDYHSSVCVCV